jgi:hypothetical protein
VLLILISVAPVAAMTALFLTCRTSSRSEAPPPQRAHDEPHRWTTEGRWEALSVEVARLERRRRALRSDAAMHRRHLAAVLPADARR